MSAKSRSYEPEYATKNRAAIKTMSLQVAVTEPDLNNAVREAFGLAKSSGRELDLAFVIQSLKQNIPKPSDIGTANLASPRAGG